MVQEVTTNRTQTLMPNPNNDRLTTTHILEPIDQSKLLSAFLSGDPATIDPFLIELSNDRQHFADGDVDTGTVALHIAVGYGSVETVRLLLSHRSISPNGIHPPGSGGTPLHVAAYLGRVDVVNLLLEQENIDDSLRDNQGKTCRDVAQTNEVIRAIDDSRSFLNASYRFCLKYYILCPLSPAPSRNLIQFLESPRVTFLDLSYLDDDSGTSLLHEAARRNDLRLIELAVRAGADVLVRDRKGKIAYEAAGENDRVKMFLRPSANHDKTLILNPAPLTEPPSVANPNKTLMLNAAPLTTEPPLVANRNKTLMPNPPSLTELPVLRGYLDKYTNFATGYNPRWFVLQGGVLSYYLYKDDEMIASRGSISMKMAILRDTEPTRFEIQSIPSRSDDSGIKWFIKANNPADAHRWTQAIANSIEWYKRTDSDAFPHLANSPVTLPPFIFTGGDNLDSWVDELNDYFSRNNFQEGERVPTAIEYLSVDVRSAIMRVQDVIQEVITEQRLTGGDDMNLKAFKEMDGSEKGSGEGQWCWSYSRLVIALRGMQNQIEEYRTKAEEARTDTILRGCAIIGGGIATAVALPVVVTGALGLVGFSAGGVVAGSTAVAIQSGIGVVRAGSLFAFCQSLAAGGGAAVSTVVGTSVAVSSVGTGVASLANIKAWLDGQNGKPSCSWADGECFVPSPELLFSLLNL